MFKSCIRTVFFLISKLSVRGDWGGIIDVEMFLNLILVKIKKYIFFFKTIWTLSAEKVRASS